jgi:hypothetical protein
METSLDGTVRTAGGRYDVYFERHFDAPLERPFVEQDFFNMRDK